VIEIRDELNSKLQEVSDVIPKISEVIQNLRNEVSEGKKDAVNWDRKSDRILGFNSISLTLKRTTFRIYIYSSISFVW